MKLTRRNLLAKLSLLTAGMYGASFLYKEQKLPVFPEDGNSYNEEKYWQLIRQQFPLNKERAYLNNATTGPCPYPVLDVVQQALYQINFTGENKEGEKAALEALSRFFKVDKNELALTNNTTQGINIIANGLPLNKKDEVIITTHEHAGNALPWINRVQKDGIVLKTFTPANTAAETLNRINELINKRTKVIALPHITCTTGHVLPVKEIARLGHDKGLWVFFDGAHGPGSTAIDLKEMDVDFYASGGHKWMLGPKGTGFLYIKSDLMDVVQTHFLGAESSKGWDLTYGQTEFEGYAEGAHRHKLGKQNAALFKGFAAAVKFMESIGMENVEKRTRTLSAYLQNKLLELPDKVEMLSPLEEQSRGPMIGFRLKKI